MELRTEHLVKIYRSKKVVNDVSLKVQQGQIVGLLGPNGAGKSTTFNMVVGVVKPYSGKVFLDDKEITDMPMYRRAQNGVGYLAQEASVFRQMTVRDNIMSILEFRKDLTKEEQKKKLNELIEEFDLGRFLLNKGIELSGGERRRTEIARALANDPFFLLLDEPFAGVDPIAVQDIQDIVAQLAEEKNIGILITDHNVTETLRITDYSYIMHDGKLLMEGASEEIGMSERAKELYLGRDYKWTGKKKTVRLKEKQNISEA